MASLYTCSSAWARSLFCCSSSLSPECPGEAAASSSPATGFASSSFDNSHTIAAPKESPITFIIVRKRSLKHSTLRRYWPFEKRIQGKESNERKKSRDFSKNSKSCWTSLQNSTPQFLLVKFFETTQVFNQHDEMFDIVFRKWFLKMTNIHRYLISIF